MIEIVINAPHLQTRGQRIGAVAVAVLGWLLWCYFLFPLVSLSCWLLVDDEQCSQWVNMAGGYLNLKDMLLLYVESVAGVALAWLLWAGYTLSRRRSPAITAPPVSLADLSDKFAVDKTELRQCQTSRYVVVHFDAEGRIVGLEKQG